MKDQQLYSDEEIVSRILRGEIALFEILIRRYNPYLYKTGRTYGYSHHDVEDLMQDTFIDAYKGLAGFENRSSFKTWIIRIMLHRCYHKRQKRSFKNELPADINEQSMPMFPGSNTDPARATTNRELSGVIEKALQSLTEDYRLVFSLREMNGLSVMETASLLELSESNVKVRLNRAKTMLRKEVEKSYVAADIFEFNLVFCDSIVEKVMNKIKMLE